MKMIAEYLENAIKFEGLAADEANPNLKADFEKQALGLSQASFGASRQARLAVTARKIKLTDPHQLFPLGPGGKPAPTLSYLKIEFLGHEVVRGLGESFGVLRSAAVLFG